MDWSDILKSSFDDIISWAETQSWCRAMADCQQDATWHAEGDVWTHTKMVCNQLYELSDWNSLTKDEQRLLFFTALFHDSAKPLVSHLDEEGRIRSPKHAVKGENLCRSVLRDLGCDYHTREQIAKLVRYHGRPTFLLERKKPENEVISLSHLVRNKLLYLFALADARGRDASDRRPEENLEFWKMVSEENDCYDNPYPFKNDHHRFTFFRSEDPNLFFIPHEEYSCTVTMFSGLPGSGKDYFIKSTGIGNVVSLDDLREELDIGATDNQGEVIQTAREMCRANLRAKIPFIFNATNLLRQTRKRWIDLFADYKARIEIAYVEPPFYKIIEQNNRRKSPVPTRVIQELGNKYEPPTLTECHGLRELV